MDAEAEVKTDMDATEIESQLEDEEDDRNLDEQGDGKD